MSRKAIIVDDSMISALVIKTALQKHGFEVARTFQNAEDFLDYFKASKEADLIVMDLVLPRMNGIEAIKKAKEISQAVKIFVVSSLGDSPEEICSAIEAGASNVVLKPFEEKAFIELIEAEMNK